VIKLNVRLYLLCKLFVYAKFLKTDMQQDTNTPLCSFFHHEHFSGLGSHVQWCLGCHAFTSFSYYSCFQLTFTHNLFVNINRTSRILIGISFSENVDRCIRKLQSKNRYDPTVGSSEINDSWKLCFSAPKSDQSHLMLINAQLKNSDRSFRRWEFVTIPWEHADQQPSIFNGRISGIIKSLKPCTCSQVFRSVSFEDRKPIDRDFWSTFPPVVSI
jgi:hypothetical protein